MNTLIILSIWMLCVFALQKAVRLPLAPYLLWVLTFPLALAVSFICWWTNPIACLFPERMPNGRDELAGLWGLWNTHDAFVDEGYYSNYFGPATPQGHYDYDHSAWVRYVYRLKWLSRNTGYGWNYLLFSIPLGTGFQLKGQSKTFFGHYNDYNIGWKSHAGFPRLDYASRIIGLRKV